MSFYLRLTSAASLALAAACRAMQYVAAAEEVQPRSLTTGYLRVKLLLSAHDPTAASAAVLQLMECEGANPDVLRVRTGCSCLVVIMRLCYQSSHAPQPASTCSAKELSQLQQYH